MPRKRRIKPRKSVGTICSPAKTYEVQILLNSSAMKEGDFVYARDERRNKVLARITSIEAHAESDITEYYADAEVLGYLEDSKLKMKRFPLKPDTKVYEFQPKELSKFLGMHEGLFIGFFADTNTEIRLNPEKLLRGHTIILGRTGCGKSWTLGVMLEEILKLGLPAVVIDPHGEYKSLSKPWKEKADILKSQGLKPMKFDIETYKVNPNIEEVELGEVFLTIRVSQEGDVRFEIGTTELVPYKEGGYSSKTKEFDSVELVKYAKEIHKKIKERKLKITGDIYSADIRRLGNGKYAVKLNVIPAETKELVKSNTVNIIDLSNLDPESARCLASELLDKLFLDRKKGILPPFIVVIEEAHIFAPSVGKEYSSDTMNMLAKEGRKFGMPTWFVSQRPQLVSTTIRANCENWIVLRITHPSDQSAIIGACEGLDSNAIHVLKNLPVGTAMITGTLVEFPILTRIRHRQSRHSYESGFKDKLKEWKKA